MLSPQNLKSYQRECVLKMLYNPEIMLWLQMGLGKTIITLTTIVDLMRAGKVKKTIIFGPIKVIESVWTTEAKKWEHTKHLRFSIIRETPEKRLRALFRDADIYLVNYEMMNWLSENFEKYFQGKDLPWQCIVYDEISKVKHSTSLRVMGGVRDREDKHGEIFKIKVHGWRKMINRFTYRYGLTGTPASNGYMDLHGQFLVLDGGKRLGERITNYRDRFFTRGYDGWSYKISDENKKIIEARISDITVKMDTKDYLDIPPTVVKRVMIDLPVSVMKKYKDAEKEYFFRLDSGIEIEIFNQLSLSNKCLQLCNGSPYTNEELTSYEKVHDLKFEALEEILDTAGGSPVLCSYSYRSDAERIMQHFKKYKPVNLTLEKGKNTSNIISKWNNGEIKLLIGHPASMGHGIDGLQTSGSIIVWFGLPPTANYEYYEQMNARLVRQGQSKPVTIVHLLCNNTLDLVIEDSIERKAKSQTELKNAIDRYRKQL